jgi:trigger factor
MSTNELPVNLNDIQIERPVASIGTPDVEDMIMTFRRQRRDWKDVPRPATMGDRLLIDYQGTVGGRAFPGGNGTKLQLILGSNAFLPTFEAALVGCKAGETRTVDVIFPADYAVANLANKEATYKVTVHAVAGERLPALDAEFARSFGIASGDLGELRRVVENNLVRELSQTLKVMVKNLVLDALYAANPQTLQPDVIEQEITRLYERARAEAMDGDRNAGAGLSRALFKDQAERRVALGMIVQGISAGANMEIDSDRVHKLIELESSAFEDPDAAARMWYDSPDKMRELETVAIEDQVVDWVLERVPVTDVRTTFRDIMRLDADA